MEGQTRLESWKEISSYLKRSIKTCQRWEIELGLPIHRLDGTPSARVFANPAELDAWMAEKLSHIRERPGAKRRWDSKKALRIAAGTLALMAAAAVPARLWIWHPPLEFPATTSCVTFLPLENVTGDERLEAWRTSLPYLISMDLVQSRVIGSMNQGGLFVTLDEMKLWGVPRYSSEDVVRIGQRLGCGHITTGSLTKADEGIALDLVLRNPQTAEITHTFRETCRGEDGIFAMTDRLSRKIKMAIGIPRRLVAHDIDERIGDITTLSPEAFHLYCRADRLVWQGKSHESAQLFQKAVDADPRFAEAYYGLFRACRGTLAQDEILRFGEKAVELSDRLNVWSRYQLRGDFYQNFKRNYDRAIAAYGSLLELMDDDLAAYSLAQIYWDLEEYERAVPLLEQAAKRAPGDESVFRLLAACHAGRGDFNEAVRVLDDHLKANPEVSANFLHIRAVYAADQGEFEEGLAFMDRLHERYPNSPGYVRYTRAPVLITMDDLARAEEELRPLGAREDKTQRVYASMTLMGLLLTQGRLAAAEEESRRSLQLAEDLGDPGWLRMCHMNKAYLDQLAGDLKGARIEIELACPAPDKAGIHDLAALHLKALIALDMGLTEEFERDVEHVRMVVERDKYPKLRRAYHHLLGRRALKEKNVDKAIDEFTKALRLLPSPIGKSDADIDSARYYSALAAAYLRAGVPGEAAKLYAMVPPYWEQRFNSGDVYARSFYGRAKAHDLFSGGAGLTESRRRAERAKALESYRKFLSLFGQADPMFAQEVNDARSRLAALAAER